MGKRIPLSDIRMDYLTGKLEETQIEKNPLVQFNLWLNDALKAELMEPTAMVIATAGPDMKPSARVVLLKEVNTEGFIFFSNYESKKGLQIDDNPQVALNFFWKELERQVRIEGTAMKIKPELSDDYFGSRPMESQISAAVSPQSKKISGRDELERMWESFHEKFSGRKIPRPSHWGGYLVKPQLIEFWQGRSSRLHDRIVYELDEKGKWLVSRLAP